MASSSATLYFDGASHPLLLDRDDPSLDTLRVQVFSLTGVDVEDQELYAEPHPGPLTSSVLPPGVLLQSASPSGAVLALVRASHRSLRRRLRPEEAAAPASASASASAAAPAWVREGAASSLSTTCTRTFFPAHPVPQPAFALRGSGGGGGGGGAGASRPFLVCAGCASSCVQHEQPQRTLVNPPPAPVPGAFACECAARPGGFCLFSERVGAEAGSTAGSPVGLEMARQLRAAVAEDVARWELQDAASASSSGVGEGGAVPAVDRAAAGNLLGRINSVAAHVRAYEDEATVAKALRTMPVALLHKQACEAMLEEAAAAATATAPAPAPAIPSPAPAAAPLTYPRALLRALTDWFRGSFFAWANNAPCQTCGSAETQLVGSAAPTPVERTLGGAGTVEVYRCCSAATSSSSSAAAACPLTRFPRYNNPAILLDTRRGRCGEFANCFTLCCIALGLEARHVTDWTDHVWTEVFLPQPGDGGEGNGAAAAAPSSPSAAGRWHHVDPCERCIDAPLLYESGWGKKLTYVVACGLDEVVDVTRRYTKRYAEVLARRTEAPEPWLARVLAVVDRQQRRGVAGGLGVGPAREAFVAARRAAEARELAANIAHDDGVRTDEESTGRISGSLAWRVARREDGAAAAAAGAAGADVSALGPLRFLSAAPAGIVTGGWQLLGRGPGEAAMEGAAAGTGPGLLLRALTSWGGQVLAATGGGADGSVALAWRAAPAPATSLSAAASAAAVAGGAWKPLTVVAAAGVAWPSPGDRLLAIAAEPKSLRLYALVGRGVGGATDSLVLVQPGTGGSKAWTATWLADVEKDRGVEEEEEGSAASLAIANGSLFRLASGRLSVCKESVVALAARADPAAAAAAGAAAAASSSTAAGPPPLPWLPVAPAPARARHLAATPAGLLLVQTEDTVSVVLSGGAAPRGPAAAAALVTVPAHAGDPSSHAGIEFAFPATLPPGGGGRALAVSVRYTAAWTRGPQAGPGDWLCLVRVGQPSESAVVVSAGPSPGTGALVHPCASDARTWAPAAGSGGSFTATFPPLALPRVPGLYELRYYSSGSGGGFGTLVGVAAAPLVVVLEAAETAAGPSRFGVVYAPLLPARNVVGLAGGANSVCTWTSSGDLWAAPAPRCLQAGSWWGGDGAVGLRPQLPSHAELTAAPPAPEEAPQQRLRRLVAGVVVQLTKGCGRVPCPSAHCAGNPAVGGPLPVNLAAARALQAVAAAVAGGKGDEELLCAPGRG
jgi:hypothetical protein